MSVHNRFNRIPRRYPQGPPPAAAAQWLLSLALIWPAGISPAIWQGAGRPSDAGAAVPLAQAAPSRTCDGSTLPAPNGLNYGGQIAYAGLAAIDCVDTAWWGPELEPVEAVSIMLRFEVGYLVYHIHVREAATRKYNEYCAAGAWTAECINSFWAYYQAILEAGRSVDRIARFGGERYFSTYVSAAREVTRSPSLRGQAGHTYRPSEWVVILEENAAESVWEWAQGLQAGSRPDEAFLRVDYLEFFDYGLERRTQVRERIALVLSFDQLAGETSPCRPVGWGCNLARAPYTQ